MLPDLSAMPHDALHTHPVAHTGPSLDTIADEELAEIVTRQLRDEIAPLPNVAPNSPATWLYISRLGDRVKAMRIALPAFGRGQTGFAMLHPLQVMAELMRLDPVESERRQTETAVQFRQRLSRVINQRVVYVEIADLQSTPDSMISPIQAQLLNNAAEDAFTDQVDPTLTNNVSARVARAVWYGSHGHSITIYRAMDWVLVNGVDQTAIALSAHPPAAMPTVTNGILNHLINANLSRSPGGQMRGQKVSRLILRAARVDSPAAIRALQGMRPRSLNETLGHVRNAVLAAAINGSFNAMAELAVPNVIMTNVAGVSPPLSATHCLDAMMQANTTVQFQVVYSAFQAGTAHDAAQISALNLARIGRLDEMIFRDVHGQAAPVTAAELIPMADIPNQPIGSIYAYQLVRDILSDRPETGQPHPNRAELAAFAITRMHPQVTGLAERTLLQHSGLPEYQNYDAQSDAFG